MYMITRRCSERRFFMRPDDETNNAFIYCLGLAAQKYEVKVIFTAAMSNHHHTGVLDVKGNLPDFLAHFHKLFAKHQNALRGRWESFWAPEQTSAVELVEAEDIINKMVYALSNPVKDHIVEKVQHWPGVNALAAIQENRPLTAIRPKTFFSPDGNQPEHISLDFHKPEALDHLSHDEFVKQLQESITAVEVKAAAEREQTHKSIVGGNAVRCQHWNESPNSQESRRNLDPRVACKNTWRRIEALARNKAWIAAYRAARKAFLGGLDACFPVGTFWLRRFAGVPCEPAPAT
jgi:putative transposase